MFTKIMMVFRDFRKKLEADYLNNPRWYKLVLLWFFRMIWILLSCLKTDLLGMRAASLTYITLISMVPCFIIMFAVIRTLGTNVLEETLIELYDGHVKTEQITNSSSTPSTFLTPSSILRQREEKIQEMKRKCQEHPRSSISIYLAKGFKELPTAICDVLEEVLWIIYPVNASKLGIIGVIVLFLSVIKMLNHVEISFNHIWGIDKHRSFFRQCIFYLSGIIFGTVVALFGAILIFSIFSSQYLEYLKPYLGEFSSEMVSGLMFFAGVIVIAFVFSIAYFLLPNTYVSVKAAIFGGLLSGLSWKIMLILYIKLQIGVTNANALYGSFAAIPLFLVWLYSSWLIVLLGAEVTFALQNWRFYDLDCQRREMSFINQVTLAMMMMTAICRKFKQGETSWNAKKYAWKYFLPWEQVMVILDRLEASQLLCKKDKKYWDYTLNKTPDLITLKEVEDIIKGETQTFLPKEYLSIQEILNVYNQDSNQLNGDISSKTFADIIQNKINHSSLY